MTHDFCSTPMLEICELLQQWRERALPGELFQFSVAHSDEDQGLWLGERRPLDQSIHRSLKVWVDLAERFDCHCQLPVRHDDKLLVSYKAMDLGRMPQISTSGDQERYGALTDYARIEKWEEPCFAQDFREAVARVKPRRGDRVLSLGVNRGAELVALHQLLAPEVAETMSFVGVDHSPSAIAKAKALFPHPNAEFLCDDIRNWDTWSLDRFHLLISIETLQSPGVDSKSLFPNLVKKLLHDRSSLILVFPNGRFVDGDIHYGARLKHKQEADWSLIIKDLFNFRRFLQGRGYRVHITGKYAIFLVAEKPNQGFL